MRRTLAFAALVATAVVVALAWWAASTVPRGTAVGVLRTGAPLPQGDVLVLPVGTAPLSLDPLVARDNVAWSAVLGYTHDGLLGFDPDSGAVVPVLADHWQVADDGRSAVYELRPGVQFSDGTPLTMADVLMSWQVAKACPQLSGPLARSLRQVDTAEVLDDRRLRVTLRSDLCAPAERVGVDWRVMQRRWLMEQIARRAQAAGKPIPSSVDDPGFAELLQTIDVPGPGTGPYCLARGDDDAPSWQPGEGVVMVQNPFSWRQRTAPTHWNLGGIQLVVESDPAGLRALLRRQAIDWCEDRDPQATLASDPELAKHYRAVLYRYDGLGPWFVVWNHDEPGLSDARVRRALTMLFDRKAIAAMLGPRAIEPQSWFPPGDPRHDPAVQPLPFDVEAARKLLAEAGWGPDHPLTLRLAFNAADDTHHHIVEMVQAAAQRAGVTIQKDPIADLGVLMQRIERRDFDGFLYMWSPDSWNDPAEVFESDAPSNWMHYSDPAVDAILEKASASPDEARRVALWREFDRLFWQDVPVTLLYHQRISALLHRRFRNAEIGPTGLSPQKWWVPPDEQLHHVEPQR